MLKFRIHSAQSSLVLRWLDSHARRRAVTPSLRIPACMDPSSAGQGIISLHRPVQTITSGTESHYQELTPRVLQSIWLLREQALLTESLRGGLDQGLGDVLVS